MCMIGDSYLGSWPLDWHNNEQHNTIYTGCKEHGKDSANTEPY